MSLTEIIAARRDELTEADRRLIEVLLADRAAGSFLPAHRVAGQAGVHASTAGRLARKLGFTSYREMRGALQDAVVADLDASVRVRRRLSRVSGSSLLGSVVDGEIRALSALATQISDSDIAEAAGLLRDAGPDPGVRRRPCQQPCRFVRKTACQVGLSGGRGCPCRLAGGRPVARPDRRRCRRGPGLSAREPGRRTDHLACAKCWCRNAADH
jgi:hypothetical protein